MALADALGGDLPLGQTEWCVLMDLEDVRHRVWRVRDCLWALRSMVPDSYRVAAEGPATETLIVMTAPFGSMGDQALAAGALRAAHIADLPSPKALVPGAAEPWHAVGIEDVESLDAWWTGKTMKLSELATERGCRADVIVIGADTVDGRYDHATLAFRLRLLNRAVRSGRRAALVNFSISGAPTWASKRLLSQLDNGVELWARDESSRSRMEQLVSRDVGLAADIGCFLPPQMSPDVLANRQRLTGVVAVLVPNAHMSTDFGISREALLAYWVELAIDLASDHTVVVMPHDVRAYPDDVGFSELIAQEIKARGVNAELFVPGSAAEAKAFVAKADVTVAARMHACVGALSSGTPTVGLDYLQKFEGQFRWYGELGETLPFESVPQVADTSAAVRRVRERTQAVPGISTNDIGWLVKR